MATPAYCRSEFHPELFSRSGRWYRERDRGSNAMSPDERKHVYRKELLLAFALVTTGLVMSGVSLIELRAQKPPQMAQATPPLQPSPPEDHKPAESKPGGERPTTPPPEPARPDAQQQKQ